MMHDPFRRSSLPSERAIQNGRSRDAFGLADEESHITIPMTQDTLSGGVLGRRLQ